MSDVIEKYLKQIKNENDLILMGQIANFSAISKTYADNQFALKQIEYSMNIVKNRIDDLEYEMNSGLNNIIRILDKIESLLIINLNEIKWLLSNIDEKLQQLINFIRFSRAKEAKELIEQGIRALIAESYDDAELVFKKALEYNITDYFAYLNLGIVYLKKKELNNAKYYFQKALQYSETDYFRENTQNPLKNNEIEKLKIIAYEFIANVCYHLKEYNSACDNIKKSIELRKKNKLSIFKAEYDLAKYLICDNKIDDGIDHLIDLCKKDAACFFISASDDELKNVRDKLILSYDNLIKDGYNLSTSLLKETIQKFHHLEKELSNNNTAQKIIDAIVYSRNKIQELINSKIYQNINVAIEMLEILDSQVTDLQRYLNIIKNYDIGIEGIKKMSRKWNDVFNEINNQFNDNKNKLNKENWEDLLVFDDYERKLEILKITKDYYNLLLINSESRKKQELENIISQVIEKKNIIDQYKTYNANNFGQMHKTYIVYKSTS